MKRKRKNKKGKPKGSVAGKNEALSSGPVVNLEGGNVDGDVNNDNKSESVMEVDTPSSTGTDQHNNLANINPDGSIDRKVGKPVGRVKVKLRTSKTMGSQPTSSDAHTQSDTDKSSQPIGVERQGVVSEKMEDSANSLPEVKIGASGNASKKAGSIKINSSKVLGSSVNHSTDPVLAARSETPSKRQRKMADQDSQNNKQELDAALMIIKKVMKMDAAEPFNVPVNPEALGIPDYFDVIDTPMDFGTICSNLEKGVKYTNSEDVFNDVQYIWNNCYKYNNKGDYILDLLRRVKKNFAKYWAAAGLYSGQPRGTDGVESTQEIIAPSDQGKVHVKGGQSKQKARKGHGRRHKSDCLCAICVLKRRRREREENARIANGEDGAIDNSLAQDFKPEESSLAESPSGGNSSSDMDGSLDPHADAEVEEIGEGEKMGIFDQQYRPSDEKLKEENNDHEGDEEEDSDTEMKDGGNDEALEKSEKLREEPNKQLQPITAEKIASAVEPERNKENTMVQHEDEIVADKPSKLQESQERHKKAYEYLQFENPMLFDICGSLFPSDSKSIWSGPHSLLQHRSSRTSSIHAAINMLMK